MAFKILAYVLSHLYNEVVVIDTMDNELVGKINRGDVSGGGGIAVTPDGKFAYCTNYFSQNASVMNTKTYSVIEPPIIIPNGYNPADIAITPEGKYAYVTNSGDDDKVYRISTITNEVDGPGIPVGNNPSSIAITPDGKFAYVTNYWSNDVSVINLATNEENRIKDIINPNDVAISPDGKYAYVAAGFSSGGVVYKIDTSTRKVTTIDVSTSLYGIAITPDGRYAYVVDRRYTGNFVYIIDLFNNDTVLPKTIPVGDNPRKIAITPDGKWAYVANEASHNVTVLDLTNNSVKTTIATGGHPYDIAIALIPEDGQADLSISKNDSPDPVKVHDTLTYTMFVKNHGPDTATGVSLIDTLLSSVKFVSSDCSQGSCTTKDGIVTCYLGTIIYGEIATIKIVVTPQKEGIITNRATVSGNEIDPNPYNNTAIEHTTVISNNICIEANRIFDSCSQEENKIETINLPCDWLHQIIYLIINNNKEYVSCSVKDIKCTVLDVTQPDEAGKVKATIKVEGIINLQLKIGDSYLENFEKTCSFTKTVTLFAPEGTKVTCEVKDVYCEFNEIENCVAYCSINMTVIIKSKALVHVKIPYVGECESRQCKDNN
ncbi:hypothetical protein SH2C18_20320 [Clostridium sediminicola]|uniref:beta-propeller fold lactonase family protein n=1 Tax=Clostridium sediminicola TaxID=3114879 RepID=UPI0031F25543